MSLKVTESNGVIDFHFKEDDIISKINSNTYKHCDFEKLAIVGGYTPIGYHGGV